MRFWSAIAAKENCDTNPSGKPMPNTDAKTENVIPTPEKRRPGRPRKNPEALAVAPKRGRPPKLSLRPKGSRRKKKHAKEAVGQTRGGFLKPIIDKHVRMLFAQETKILSAKLSETIKNEIAVFIQESITNLVQIEIKKIITKEFP